jgi:activator of HSP90 ATPase
MDFYTSAITRRNSIVAIAGAIGALAFGPLSDRATGQEAAALETPAATKLRTSLHQRIDLSAPPKRVYEVLMDEKQFAVITGLPAKIDSAAGGAFKTFGGLIEGRNVELIPAQRIVQAWREASWEPGFYSMVHFELTARGKDTTLVLEHTGFHEGDFGHLDPGWHQRYWEPLKRYLAA